MVTEKKFTTLENSQASLTLTIDAASIEKAYTEKMNEYAKKVELPGFRKGHIPATVLERKIGDQVRSESTFDLMESELQETIKTLEKGQKPLSYSVPELQDEESLLPFKKDSDLTFTVKYDVYPVFDLPEYKGLEVEYVDKEVTDDDVAKEIESLREQNAIVVNKSTQAAKGDIATVDYETEENGLIDTDFSREDFSFTIGSTYNTFKLDDDVVGMSVGESKVVTRAYAEGDENAPAPEFQGKELKITVTLKKLKERELPEVDDEFAQDVKDEYKTVEDLKAGVRKDLEEKLNSYRTNVKQDAVIKAIMKNTDITVPETMVSAVIEGKWQNFVKNTFGSEKTFLDYLKSAGQSKESFTSSWHDEAKEDAKEELLLAAIADKENFEVTEDEIREVAGAENYDKLSDEDKNNYREYFTEELKYQKVMPFLVENNTFKAVKEEKKEEKAQEE